MAVEKRTVVFTAVMDDIRNFGENGAAVKAILNEPSTGATFEAEYSSNRENAAKHRDAMKALMGGPPVEVEGEPGQYGFKLKEYPGKPTGGGGGKGQRREWVPRYVDSAAAVQYEQERMDRRTALMQAVANADVGTVSNDIVDMAGDFYEFLRGSHVVQVEPASPAAAPAASDGKTAAPTTPTGSRVQEIITLAGGDAHGVPRAKKMLKERLGHDQFDQVPDEEWTAFLAEFTTAEASV